MDNKKKIKQVEEQNAFLRSLLKGFDDVKKGRVKPFKFTTTKKA
jgi:hypothetical protein